MRTTFTTTVGLMPKVKRVKVRHNGHMVDAYSYGCMYAVRQQGPAAMGRGWRLYRHDTGELVGSASILKYAKQRLVAEG